MNIHRLRGTMTFENPDPDDESGDIEVDFEAEYDAGGPYWRPDEPSTITVTKTDPSGWSDAAESRLWDDPDLLRYET